MTLRDPERQSPSWEMSAAGEMAVAGRSARESQAPWARLKAHSLVAVLTRICVAGLGFLASVLVARWLGPEGKGVLATLMVVPMLVVSFAELGIRQAAARAIGKGLATAAEVFSAIVGLWVLMSFLSLSIVLGYAYLTGASRYGLAVTAALAAAPAAMLMVRYGSGIALGQQWIGKVGFSQTLVGVVNLLSVVLFILVLGMGILGAVLGRLVASAAGGGMFLYWFVAGFGWKWRWRPAVMWLLARRGVSFALALFVLGLNYRVSILLLQLFVGPGDIGQFSLGVNISETLWVVPSAIGMVIFSHSTGAGDAKAFTKTTARIARLGLIAAAAVAAAVAMSCDALVGMVYGQAYRASVPVIQLMPPGIVCVVFFKILNSDLAGRGHPLVAAKVFLGAIVVNVAATCLLAPRWGIVGAGIAVSISYALGSLVFAREYAKMSGLQLTELLVPRMEDFRGMAR